MPLGAHKAAIMGVSGTATTGDVVLLSSQTASDDASISFTSGIDSTYGEYIFRLYIINPETDLAEFTFNGSIDAGSNYNVTKTTTWHRAYHSESDLSAAYGYDNGSDLAQSTDYQRLAEDVGNGADECCAGELHLFNPSGTTYAKHFYAKLNSLNGADSSYNHFIAGYFNTTDNIDAIDFKMSTGNFDGKIKLWGVK